MEGFAVRYDRGKFYFSQRALQSQFKHNEAIVINKRVEHLKYPKIKIPEVL